MKCSRVIFAPRKASPGPLVLTAYLTPPQLKVRALVKTRSSRRAKTSSSAEGSSLSGRWASSRFCGATANLALKLAMNCGKNASACSTEETLRSRISLTRRSCKAHTMHPHVSRRIARTETQGLDKVSLCFFGATDKNLTKSNIGMGPGEISIELQRALTFGDALFRALGEYVDNSQQRMHKRAVWEQRHGFGQLRFRVSKGGHRSRAHVRKHVRACRFDERVDIGGIGGERAIEKAARLLDVIRGRTLIEPGQTLKIEVDRVGVRGLFRPSRLGGGELGVQRVRQARDDFVLHVEQIGHELIE